MVQNATHTLVSDTNFLEWEVLCQHIVLEIRVHTYLTIRRLYLLFGLTV